MLKVSQWNITAAGGSEGNTSILKAARRCAKAMHGMLFKFSKSQNRIQHSITSEEGILLGFVVLNARMDSLYCHSAFDGLNPLIHGFEVSSQAIPAAIRSCQTVSFAHPGSHSEPQLGILLFAIAAKAHLDLVG